MNRYDILESISQGENRTMPEENTLLVQIADDIRRTTEGGFNDETESFSSREHVIAEKIGTKKSFISRIENGHTDVQISTLAKIFSGLGRRVAISLL